MKDYDYSFNNQEQYETFRKTKLLDGSINIDYEFSFPDSIKDNSLYISSTVTIENGTKVGNVYTMRKGERIYSILIT